MTQVARQHFRLLTPSKALDKRVNAARPDLADVAIAAYYFSPHYARPLPKTVTSERAGVYNKPDKNAVMVSELLMGEVFSVLEVTGEWAWGYCVHDHYVGYVPHSALGNAQPAKPAPAVADFVKDAESYLNTPYVWGGRSHFGIDCSGLVQVALASAGRDVPRDADQQMAAVGQGVGADAALKRGDLIFFPGHVGIMTDDTNMVHATGFHGKVVIEPLADVVARVAEKHDPAILARKRLS